MKIYKKEEVTKATLDYFDGDELAANVWVTKYALRDLENNYYELTPEDMHNRLAGEFSRIEEKYPNPMPRDEILDLLKDFKYVVPQGSPMSGIGNPYQIQSISNCFVIDSPEDSYGGILYTDQQQVQIMKRRGGVGFDISNIRPRGISCKNAARTTDGIELFMERFSNSCREVAQGGRRGALMLSISVHHPQVLDFVKIKRDLKKVTGANVSVRISDEFMKAVKSNGDYEQRWPIDSDSPKISKHVDAIEVWNEIVESAHMSAEPGILFWDTAVKNTPSDIYSDEGFGSTSTNPCGEIILSPGDSCRLMLVNLTNFIENPWTENAAFNTAKYVKIVRKAQRLMDNMIDLELEQIDKIISKIEKDPEASSVKKIEKDLWEFIKDRATQGRRTGLGVTGVGDAIAMLGQTYGSEESISTVEHFYKNLAVGSYTESINLAKERGCFPVFDPSKELDHNFLNRIFNELDEQTIQEYKIFGRRNIANTTTAPAGSVSCLTQTTSGIEPSFMLHYTRRRKINPQDGDVRVDFVDDLGDKWQEYTVYHHKFKEWMDSTDSDCDWQSDDPSVAVSHSPYSNATANEIDWVNKVWIQAAAQKWVCHAISNTTNLPADVDVDTVKKVYEAGWEAGCKGITIYRDGSRSGVLVDSSQKSQPQKIQTRHAPKRPEALECDIYHTSVKDERWVVLVGLLDDRPYEVIGGKAELIEVPRKHKSGTLSKRSYKTTANKYDLKIGEGDDALVIKDIVSVFDNPNYAGYTRTISLALRHGAPVQYLVEQMQKDKEADLFSFSKVIARCLKKYIADGTKASVNVCTNCGAEGTIIYQEGCQTCSACGHGACG
ncbi:MAG: ribonucleoside-diphosphate reductase, adenosylcobalamin-dependent [Methylococcaceae bacterium TMED69]|nr:MAG: ribonucleoside-diphosphate reductase, adenosylcobalamin-dependent [Methylococcaceae bacterium TMED69]